MRKCRRELGEREEERRFTLGEERLKKLGLRVKPLTPGASIELGFTHEVAEELGFGPDEKPVVVIEVDSLSQAAEKGIQVHDIITEIDQERITSAQNFMRSISTSEGTLSAVLALAPGPRRYVRAAHDLLRDSSSKLILPTGAERCLFNWAKPRPSDRRRKRALSRSSRYAFPRTGCFCICMGDAKVIMASASKLTEPGNRPT